MRILQPSQETHFVVVVQDGREMWMAVRDWGGYSGRKYCVLLERTHAAGKYPDIEISRSGLAHWLGEFGRVEADEG